jgi:hypothetical protein
MDGNFPSKLSITTRLGLAWKCFWRTLLEPEFARQMCGGPRPAPPADPPPAPVRTSSPVVPPERAQAAGLLVLSLLQREGRLIDFLQEDVAAFSDAEVGAAARAVHAGCKKVLAGHFTLEPVLKEAEGDPITLAAGFDAQRIRLTGNVAGQPPFRGTLKHHGWVASAVRLPTVAESLDPRILTPAEVEI